MTTVTESWLTDLLKSEGFTHWGVAAIERPHSFEHYRQWLDQGCHGEMSYLKLHLPQKETPEQLLPMAKTALVLSQSYFPDHPESLANWPIPSLPVAAYAQGKDYHFWFRERLQGIVEKLKHLHPQDAFLAMTDSHPVMERDLARRAGLGWFGKNTCVIDPKHGSLFLLGEIYTSLKLEVTAPTTLDHCGTCRRCLDSCPTQAFTSERVLDARKCISYWTIEARSNPPAELRHAIGQWFFGCDICQTVCPWNEKLFGRGFKTNPTASRADLVAELRLILGSSNKKLNQMFANTPLSRTGGRGLKRNAILMVAHHRLEELSDDIRREGARHPELTELQEWACLQLHQDPGS